MKKLICIISLGLPFVTHAFSWEDLWLTKNQQAQKMMEKNQFFEASQRFEDSNWRATAAYRAEHYNEAASGYQTIGTDDGYFNQGNALAHQGQYEAALKAYDHALKMNPHHKDALYNRAMIEKLLNKDKQDKQNQDKQNQDKQNQDKQNQDKQNQDKQNQDKQNQDKQNQDKQNQDKQNQDKQNQDKQNADMSSAEKEKQRAKEQWLKLVPDDPGGLMREKFLRDHLRRQNRWGS